MYMSKNKKIITEYRHYDLPSEFPILVLSGDRWHISDVKSDRLHFHNYMEFGICHSESGRMDFGSESVSYKSGDVTCITRNFPHTTYSDAGVQSLWSWIFVDLDAFCKKINPSNPKTPMGTTKFFIYNKDEIPRLYSYLTAVIEEMSQEKPGYKMAVTGLMSAICVEIARITENNNTSSAAFGSGFTTIQPALDFIAEEYMRKFTMEDLADMCHLSPTHFRRIFNTIMGTSPLEYVNDTRIDQACIALQNTDISILEISESVGFLSISSFNRAFAKRCEISPREWRKKYNHGNAPAKKTSIMEYRGWL